MNAQRSIPTNRALLHSIALLMVVAFAWQSCGGDVALADQGRGEGIGQRITSRAIVERCARATQRLRERQREEPAAVCLAARRARPSAAAVLPSKCESSGPALLCRHLLDLPPPHRG